MEMIWTKPTLQIACFDDYKERMDEIFSWQIHDSYTLKVTCLTALFDVHSVKDFFTALLLTIFGLVTMPIFILYFLLCLGEAVLDTLLLPFFLIPIVRLLPTAIVYLYWTVTAFVGFFAGAALMRL